MTKSWAEKWQTTAGTKFVLVAKWSPHSFQISLETTVFPHLISTLRPSPVTYNILSAQPRPSAPWSHQEDLFLREPFYACVCRRWNHSLDGWNKKKSSKKTEGYEWVIYQIDENIDYELKITMVTLWNQGHQDEQADQLALLQTKIRRL